MVATAILLLPLLLASTTYAWTSQAKVFQGSIQTMRSTQDNFAEGEGVEDFNPCWQDIEDDECALTTVYSASFVARDWIKRLPCAAGVEDCDMPEPLTMPGTDGIEQVDVMDFLGLTRAKPVEKKESYDI